MLSENRFKKYLLYAIGEILLVVIGILIALQINEVVQDRQRAKLEKVLLEQLKLEILGSYEDIWRDLEHLRLGDRSHDNITNYIRQDLPYNDSLCFDFYWLKIDEYFYPPTAAYGRIKQVGLNIVKNDTLQDVIQALYEGHFPRLSINASSIPDISHTFSDYYLNQFTPNTDFSVEFNFELPADTIGQRIFSNEYYDYPNIDKESGETYTIGYVPLDFEAMKQDTKFLMLLDQTKGYRHSKIRHYKIVKELVKLAVNSIDKQLGTGEDQML